MDEINNKVINEKQLNILFAVLISKKNCFKFFSIHDSPLFTVAVSQQ
jgi:hypothetical protein